MNRQVKVKVLQERRITYAVGFTEGLPPSYMDKRQARRFKRRIGKRLAKLLPLTLAAYPLNMDGAIIDTGTRTWDGEGEPPGWYKEILDSRKN